jgi:hypothetical protein
VQKAKKPHNSVSIAITGVGNYQIYCLLPFRVATLATVEPVTVICEERVATALALVSISTAIVAVEFVAWHR